MYQLRWRRAWRPSLSVISAAFMAFGRSCDEQETNQTADLEPDRRKIIVIYFTYVTWHLQVKLDFYLWLWKAHPDFTLNITFNLKNPSIYSSLCIFFLPLRMLLGSNYIENFFLGWLGLQNFTNVLIYYLIVMNSQHNSVYKCILKMHMFQPVRIKQWKVYVTIWSFKYCKSYQSIFLNNM